MFYVPLYIEALRSRPRPVFWVAVLAQAALWLAVPTLFYAAPPGDLAHLLAVAHNPPLRPDVGPPLAYWLADFAFRTAGMLGIYLLSQACVVVAFWCVFALGRAMVGPTHAVMAVLILFTIASRRGRAAAQTFEAWIAWAIVAGMVYVHFEFLERAGFALKPTLERLRIAGAAAGNTGAWFKLLG